MKPSTPFSVLVALAATSAIACSPGAEDAAAGAEASMHQPSAERVAMAAESDASFVVYKSPTCGCCSGWVDHIEAAGHDVETVDVPVYADLSAKKAEQGVPIDLGACHTALVDGYVIEGHVPAEVVERLLRERPDIKGIAVPGMPIGSPGMEGPNPQPYDVIAFTESGERSVYERVDPRP